MTFACDKIERLGKPLLHELWGMTCPWEKQQTGRFIRFRGG